MNNKNNENKKLKVVLAGGGTGGHIYPAVAIAQRLKKDEDIEKVYYFGCQKNMEYEIAKKESLDFLAINISGMPRKISSDFIKWGFDLLKSIRLAYKYFIDIKPDVVVGTGGYVSGPALIAANILKIPILMHDPDAHPGIVSRFMSSKADLVSISFEQAKGLLNSKNIVLNGNPIRNTFGTISKEQAIEQMGLDINKKTILVIGGSQGAKRINDAIITIAKTLIEDHGFQIIHQTGRRNYDEHMEALNEYWVDYNNNSSYIVKPYFEDMSIPLNCADLAVSRAGSLSISELNLCELPSILVPYPFAAADHQRYNARAMEKSGAALYLEDDNCNSINLLDIILKIFHDENKLNEMKNANKLLSKPNSAENIICQMKEVIAKNKKTRLKSQKMITYVLILFIGILAMSSVYLKNNVAIDDEIVEVNVSETHKVLNKRDYIIVDVREEDEFEEGHINTALNVPLSDFRSNYKTIPNSKHIILVCRSGRRSLSALSFLKDHGYDHIANMTGGMVEWAKAGFHIEK